MLLVSIIIPAYNAEKYIGRAIESALGQTYKDIEIIVVDDGSTDRTAEIVRSFQDPKIRYLRQENKFQGAARNYGIKESRGEYITFLDADDMYLPEKVERQVKFLQEHPEYDAAYCNAVHFYSRNPDKFYRKKGSFPSGDIFSELLHSSLINPNCAIIRRGVLEKVGGFSEVRYWPEEWDLWLRIARAGYKFGYMDEDLVKVEIREGSNTTMEIQPILKKYTLDMFEKLFSEMPPQEREKYGSESVLDGIRAKLAVSYLLNNRINEFWALPISHKRLLALGLLLPPFLRKKLLIAFWLWRQRRGFKRV